MSNNSTNDNYNSATPSFRFSRGKNSASPRYNSPNSSPYDSGTYVGSPYQKSPVIGAIFHRSPSTGLPYQKTPRSGSSYQNRYSFHSNRSRFRSPPFSNKSYHEFRRSNPPDISLFMDRTALEDPWAELELELKNKMEQKEKDESVTIEKEAELEATSVN